MFKLIKKIVLVSIALVAVIAFFYFKMHICRRGICLGELGQQRVKKIVRKISGKIYQEATEHNPRGDWLPDWIDDAIKEKLKTIWRRKIEG
jgi:hypothetical protein